MQYDAAGRVELRTLGSTSIMANSSTGALVGELKYRD